MTKTIVTLTFSIVLLLALMRPSYALEIGEIYDRSIDSVVTVVSLDQEGDIMMTGTGFYVKGQYLIATNNHVIEKAKRIKIVTSKNSEHEIFDVCIQSKREDIAILRATFSAAPIILTPLIRRIGDEIIAIGSPMGLPGSLSTGVVGALRDYEGLSYYQITSPISPGSSGGPILNNQGQAIGMTTFYIKDAQNLNFAIPSNRISQHLTNIDSCLLKNDVRPSEETINSYAVAFLEYFENNRNAFPESRNIDEMAARCAASVIGSFATDDEMRNLTTVFTKNSKATLDLSRYRETALKSLINYISSQHCKIQGEP